MSVTITVFFGKQVSVITMAARMITTQLFFSTSNSGKNYQDPAKDPRIPENGHNYFLV